MRGLYADVIIDISHEAIDRTFQYAIPDDIAGRIQIGSQVNIPFGKGNNLRKGYVIGISDSTEYDESRIKSIDSLCEDGVAAPGRLLALAADKGELRLHHDKCHPDGDAGEKNG